MKIKEILTIKGKSQEVKIKGWVRTRRGSKHVSFIALNDGSTINNIQVIAEGDSFPEEIIRQITTGSCIFVEGNLVESKGSGQAVEILANKIEIIPLETSIKKTEIAARFPIFLKTLVAPVDPEPIERISIPFIILPAK